MVAQEQGGLALLGGTTFTNHPQQSVFTVKVARSLFAGASVYGGGVFGQGQDGVVAGLEWDAKVLKLQVPLVTYIPAGQLWYTPANANGPALTFVFNLEQLSPYQLLRGGNFSP